MAAAAQSPAGVHADVWLAIVALALYAMERGRRYQWAHSKEHSKEDDAGQPLITDFFPRLDGQPHAQPEAFSVAAGRWAVAWFWCAAQDITFSGQVPQPWISIGSQHPLFLMEGGSLPPPRCCSHLVSSLFRIAAAVREISLLSAPPNITFWLFLPYRLLA